MSEFVFFHLLKEAGIQRPVSEYRFSPPRRWRFDYAFVASRVAVEVEGGVWTRGRHTRGKGFINDMEKYNRATVLGWRVLRVTPSQLATLETVELICEALAACYDITKPVKLVPWQGSLDGLPDTTSMERGRRST